MKNPGLEVFASPPVYVRPSNHPSNFEDEYSDDEDRGPEYIPPVGFGRWRNPGQSLHIHPTHVGPAFAPGENPSDVIQGEIVTPAEQDSADKILNGDHESDAPSANPFVETARRDLHTPGSAVAVGTLSRLLNGEHPSSMSPEAMDAAHEYLSKHFTGLKVNPSHGTLVAVSPTGAQMVKRQVNLPAVREHHPEPPSYELTNKHGTFESDDPQRLVRAMVAFQIVHNEIAARSKKDKDDDSDDGLSTTSGFFRRMRDAYMEGYNEVKPFQAPKGAVFEPGHGTDANEHGVLGGYVMAADEAPMGENWHFHGGTAFSPGHNMRLMLDPNESSKPRPDTRFLGHTFTYQPNHETGHTVLRNLNGLNYYVRNHVHPAAQGVGFDLPSRPRSQAPQTPQRLRKMPPPQTRAPRPPDDGPKQKPPVLSPPSSSASDIPPPPPYDPAHPERWAWGGEGRGWYRQAASNVNDLCPVCASGYLEPYDSTYHECLNCGSLVTHVGFEKQGTKKPPRNRGGLGSGLNKVGPRGLGQSADLDRGMEDFSGDPLGVGSENPVNVIDLDKTEHPLVGEEMPEDYEEYVAPRRILGAYSEIPDTPDEIDEHMGKLGYQPLHNKPGQPRAYFIHDPTMRGSHFRLTEGVPVANDDASTGWVLTADHVPAVEDWTKGGLPYPQHSISLEPRVKDPTKPTEIRRALPDAGNRAAGRKTILAKGTHPIEDDSLNRALRDVALNGRNSATYQNAFMDTAYEPPRIPETGTQRELRQLSSVGNPGLSRFAE